jgi:PAS domain-containing protein
MAKVQGANRIPAVALIAADGHIERCTDAFQQRHNSNSGLHKHSGQIARILNGDGDAVPVGWGDLTGKAEGVIDADGTRHVLLMLTPDESSPGASKLNALLDVPLDETPAIVWLKDLDGRYLRVNSRYTAHVGATEEQICGRTDAELSPRESIDAPRLQRVGGPLNEPLQFEYIVPAFEKRPALTVLRFAVHNRDGDAIAACSVAATPANAHIARAETARLMMIERASWLDPDDLRDELLSEWGVRELASGVGDEQMPTVPTEPPTATGPQRETTSSELAAAREHADRARAEAAQARRHAKELATEVKQSLARAARAEAEVQEARAAAQNELAEAHVQRDAAVATRDEVAAQLADMQVQLDELRREREANASELEQQLAEARADTQQTKAAAEGELAAAITERDAALAANDELASQLEAIQEQLAQLRRDREADDSELQRQLDEARAEAEQLQAAAKEELAAAHAERDAAAAGRDELVAQLLDAQEQLTERDEAQQEALQRDAAVQDELAAAIAERDAALAAKDDLARELEEAGQQLAELRRESEADETELHQQLEALRLEREQAQKHAEQREAAAQGQLSAVLAKRDSALAAKDELARQLERATQQLEELRRESEADETGLQRQLEEVRHELDHLRSEAEQRELAAQEELAAAYAERDSAVAEKDELAGNLEEERLRIASFNEESENLAEYVQELERTMASEREQKEELERFRDQAQQRLDDLETVGRASDSEQQEQILAAQAAADQARTHAAATKAEAEEARVRAEELQREVERLENEVRKLRGDVPGPISSPAIRWSPAAQRSFSASLLASSELRSGLKEAVKELGLHGGWDAVTAWILNDREALTCGAMWTATTDLSEFDTITWQTRTAASRSILADVLPASSPTWLTSIPDDAPGDPRLDKAASYGMQSAVLIPVRDGSGPLAVLELLTRTRAEEDPEVLTALEAVALQLSQFAHLLKLGAKPHWQLGRL